ncbi:MAG: hypothetical protein LBT46_11925 [Planctomycetaceae bacterium]|nr:hypothetical protein [Planctomycetaceae bacterium]
MKIFRTAIQSALVIGCLVLFLFIVAANVADEKQDDPLTAGLRKMGELIGSAGKKTDDPLTVLFDEYKAYRTSVELKFEPVKEREWAAVLSKALTAHRQSPSANRVLLQLIANYNTLDDCEASAGLMKQELDRKDSTADKVFLYHQLLGSCSKIALGLYDQGKKEKAKEYAEEAVICFAKYQESVQKSSVNSSYDTVQELMLLSAIIGLQNTVLEKPEKAVDLCSQAIEKFKVFETEKQFDKSFLSGYTLDYFYILKMESEIQAKDSSAALETLKRFGELKEHPHSVHAGATYYAAEILTKLYPQRKEDFCKALFSWVESHPEDKGAPSGLFQVAHAYFSKRAFDKALPVLLTLHDKYWKQIVQNDISVLGAGKGGTSEFILDMLIIIYQQRGDAETAQRYIDELREHVPKRNLSTMLSAQESIRKRAGYAASAEAEL